MSSNYVGSIFRHSHSQLVDSVDGVSRGTVERGVRFLGGSVEMMAISVTGIVGTG